MPVPNSPPNAISAIDSPEDGIPSLAAASGFSLPDVGDKPLSREEMSRLVQQAVEEMAALLGCERLVALAYLPATQQFNGVTAAGFFSEEVRTWSLPVASFPFAARAIAACEVRITEDADDIPPPLAAWFSCCTVVVPLAFGDRVLAVLVGQMRDDVDPHSASWQARVREVGARAALVVELLRVGSEYQEELRRRQYTRELAAAILENRPVRDVAKLVTDLVAARLNVERVALYLADGVDSVYPVALRNVSTEYGNTIARFATPSAPMARAMATGLPYYTRDVQNDPNFSLEKRALYRREGITSVLRGMLQHGERVLGALVVYPQAERILTPQELSLFQSFTDMTTLGIAISQQMEQQRGLAMVEERSRLAREMHDTVAQTLAALLLQIETTQTYLTRGEQDSAREMLGSARMQAKKALEDTRRAIQGLSPTTLERLSLAEALEAETHELQYQTDIAAQFILTGEEQSLNPDQRAALLRIAQESLANARRHAQARRVRVGLQYGPDEVTLLVEDDGVGFDVAARAMPDANGGYGLFGMNERARLAGGEIAVESTPGWGTRVRASVPYRPASLVEAGRQAVVQPTMPVSVIAGSAVNAASGIPALAAPYVVMPVPFLPTDVLPASGEARIRVLVVDDHVLARQGVRAVLEASGDVEVVGEAGNGAQGAERAQELHPDVVLMDWQMPESDGLDGLNRIHAAQPALPVVILTTFQTDQVVAEALGAGARGFLLKDADPVDLLGAVRAAHRGETLLAASVTDRLAALASGQTARAHNDAGLNERELEVLQLLAQGARNKEIAARLFIAPKTVEYHLSNIFSKLDVSNRTEAARAALERSLIAPNERAGK